jgi:AraC family transcriptional regulator
MSAAARSFSEASLCSSNENRIASSLDAGWTSVLLEHQRTIGTIDYVTKPTPDQTLLVITRGRLDLATRGSGRWWKHTHEVGSAALTPSGTSAEHRLEPRGTSRSVEAALLYIPQHFFTEAADHYRAAGQSFREEPLCSLGFHDATVAHSVFALLRAMDGGAPDLYAETVAQWLATHLLSTHTSWRLPSSPDRSPGLVSDQRLARVIDFMTIHFAESLSLERLAREAGISKFHFAHLFRERTGMTPHRYLVQLRMDAARRMLTTTELTVSEIAAACGYETPAHFGAAFQRRHKQSPGTYRAHHRS